MALWLCVAAIVIAIVTGWRFKFNTGIIAMCFAFFIGNFVLNLKINEIIGFWPTAIVFYLLAISLFFNYANENGTMDVLGKKLLFLLGGNAKLIPLAIAAVCAIVSGLGAGATTPAIIGPFAFMTAISAGISPVSTAVAIGYGTVIGANNPYNGYGGVIAKNLIIANKTDPATAVVISNYCWLNSIIMSIIIILAFYFINKCYRAKNKALENPPAFDARQKKTFVIIIASFVLMIIPSFLSAWFNSVELFTKLAAFCQPQTIMILGAALCAAMRLAPEKEVIKKVPLNTIIMIVGVYMLIQVATKAGLLNFISGALSDAIPKWLVPPALVCFAAFLAFFSSATAVVLPLMFPLVPALAANLGINPVMLYSCIFFGSCTTAMSPFSIGGAITIAACPDNDVKESLPNKMIVAALMIFAMTLVLTSLGIFDIFSL